MAPVNRSPLQSVSLPAPVNSMQIWPPQEQYFTFLEWSDGQSTGQQYNQYICKKEKLKGVVEKIIVIDSICSDTDGAGRWRGVVWRIYSVLSTANVSWI